MSSDVSTYKLLNEFEGTRCRCGARKMRRQSFCRRCYYSLPKKLRINLYRRIGRGYEEAYQVAVDYLEGNGDD